MHAKIMNEIKELENVVFVCFGQPKGDELPQVASQDAVIIDMVSSCTGKPMHLVEEEIHHQTDPSYQ